MLGGRIVAEVRICVISCGVLRSLYSYIDLGGPGI